jgi:carotenoid 1,2-hydratase
MSAPLAVPALPRESGSYLWLYTDVVAGDLTAVCIFLVGSVFSPRYAAGLGRRARPLEHCAVNFALYRSGHRIAWAFTEYPGIARATGESLAIGDSTLVYAGDGSLVLTVAERTAPWARSLLARLTLTPTTAAAPEVSLDARRRHRWEARIPRAAARLELPDLGITRTGIGYHDANHGAEALGDGVSGWWWSRLHTPERTLVRYRTHGGPRTIELEARVGTAARTAAVAAPEPALRRSAWGLALPRDIGAGDVILRARHLLESSPFYARQETRLGELHALGESADFRRFRSPLIRWMAYFRMRTERAA